VVRPNCSWITRYPETETRRRSGSNAPQHERAGMLAPARLLIGELGSACVQYSFRSQLSSCEARPTVNKTRQPDFLSFETSCSFNGCLLRRPQPGWGEALPNWSPKMGILANGERQSSISR
jgi:hypothetical protein